MFSWYWMMKYSCVCCSFFSSFSVSWVTRRSSSKVWLICRCFWDMASARLLAGEVLCREGAPGQCCAPHAWGRERLGCRGGQGGRDGPQSTEAEAHAMGQWLEPRAQGGVRGPRVIPAESAPGLGWGSVPGAPERRGERQGPPAWLLTFVASRTSRCSWYRMWRMQRTSSMGHRSYVFCSRESKGPEPGAERGQSGALTAPGWGKRGAMGIGRGGCSCPNLPCQHPCSQATWGRMGVTPASLCQDGSSSWPDKEPAGDGSGWGGCDMPGDGGAQPCAGPTR